MDPSYSLRIPQKEVVKQKRRKRKVIQIPTQMTSSYKYRCYHCSTDVYFLPGHELVCSTCASRIVEKVRLEPQKRIIAAR